MSPAALKLRAIKPSEVKAIKRLKALIFGPAGIGKTTAAIQMPRPYLIDTERGAENDQYTKLLEQKDGAYWACTDFDELIREVQSLLSLKHDFRTLIIDPITGLYNDLVDKAAIKVGTDFGRHYGEANKKMRHLINLLLRLDMNLIMIAHGRTEYGDGMSVLGQTFDGWKKLDYLFDLVFEIQKRGKERIAVTRKTRVEGFPDGDTFPFSYGEIARRYGTEILEKESVPQILATPEEVAELERLIQLFKVESETVEKWLKKAEAATLQELPQDSIQKCISYLSNQIQPQKGITN